MGDVGTIKVILPLRRKEPKGQVNDFPFGAVYEGEGRGLKREGVVETKPYCTPQLVDLYFTLRP